MTAEVFEIVDSRSWLVIGSPSHAPEDGASHTLGDGTSYTLGNITPIPIRYV